MLVPWGLFAQHIGLIEELAKVPIPQRSQEHTPQSKLIEFFVAILGGCAYLQDISRGVHPLDQDQAVADAWGQPGRADHSGVSRSVHHCTAETVQAVRQAGERVSRPFIDREVVLAVQESGGVVYDGDLTGRPVSSTSMAYPGTGLLEQRIGEQRIELQQARRRLGEKQAQVQVTQRKVKAASDEWRRSLQVAHWMELDGLPRGVSRPHSRLAKARQRVAVRWRRLQRRSREAQRARQAVARQSQKVHRLQNELATLEARLVHLLEENRTNRGPVQATFRLDGGFGSGENLAFLIEMGYIGQQERYATLVHYGSQAVGGDLVRWFDFYNARQEIEAGVKEGKRVFEMHHLKVRSSAGLAIQEEFTVLAANLLARPRRPGQGADRRSPPIQPVPWVVCACPRSIGPVAATHVGDGSAPQQHSVAGPGWYSSW